MALPTLSNTPSKLKKGTITLFQKSDKAFPTFSNVNPSNSLTLSTNSENNLAAFLKWPPNLAPKPENAFLSLSILF